jgi:hypothetical protein
MLFPNRQNKKIEIVLIKNKKNLIPLETEILIKDEIEGIIGVRVSIKYWKRR